RMRPGGDLGAAGNRHPLTRDRLLGHAERDQLALRSLGLDPAKLVGTSELLVELADPAEAGRDRVGVGPDVVSVQRVADLEPKRVARAEAARHRAPPDDRVPDARCALGRAQPPDDAL